MSWNKSRLYGEQKICPRNKLWLENMEQKYRIRRTNHVYGGKKKFRPQNKSRLYEEQKFSPRG
jgi:hypothetical protein